MKSKHTLILFASLVLSFTFILTFGSTVSAYQCSPPSTNLNGQQYQVKTDGGACYIMTPNEVSNNGGNRQVDGSGNVTCTNGTVKHDDGNCWTYQKHYLTGQDGKVIMPKQDDGSDISDSVLQNVCEQQEAYYGTHWNYNKSLGACEAAGGCTLTVGGLNTTSDDGSRRCRVIGQGTKSLPTDTTTGKVNNCKQSGGTVNTTTHQCDITQQQCESKGGTWDNGQQDSFKKCTPKNSSGSTTDPSSRATGFTSPGDLNGDAGQCGTAKTNLITCDCSGQTNTVTASGSAQVVDNTKCSGVQVLAQILKIVLFVLTVLVGIAAVGGIAYSAILYASAEDNASNTSKAKEYIRNIVIGLLAYALMVAIIGWLVPGSVIG